MEIEMPKPAAILGFESKREISRGSSMSLSTYGISSLPDMGWSALGRRDSREISK